MKKRFEEIKIGELFKIDYLSPVTLMKTSNFVEMIPIHEGDKPTGEYQKTPGNSVVYSGDKRGEFVDTSVGTDYYIPEDQNEIIGGLK
jgi:hypothetical protein